MSSARSLLSGAAWTYGAQFMTMTLQFGYAAITSRLVAPDGFGSYAVALAVTGFVTLIANGGLAQTAGRLLTIDVHVLRGLSFYALLIGVASAFFLWVSAGFWSHIWGADGAKEPIQWMSIAAAIAPCLGLSSGLLRRRGSFKSLAAATFVSNTVGMALGAFAVTIWGTASSLLVSAIMAQLLTLLATLFLNRQYLWGFASLKMAREEIRFSRDITISSLLGYLVGNINKWSATNVLGASVLGFWNRADVLTTVPFQQIQTAMIQTVYPEFRHDLDNRQRTAKVWPDLLALVAWVTVPASVVVAVILPKLVPIIFGPGWDGASDLIPALAIIAGIQPATTVLASAIEALAKFRWVWSTQLILLAIQLVAAVAVFRTQLFAPVLIGLALTHIARHAWHIFLCHRSGYMNVRVIAVKYLEIIIAAFALWTITTICMYLAECLQLGPWRWLLLTLVVLVFLGLLFALRERIPLIQIMRKYGFF